MRLTMDTDLRTFLSERLNELEKEAEHLRARLKRCEAEIGDIQKAAEATEITLFTKADMAIPRKCAEITRKIERNTEYTMKDAAVRILNNQPDGLTANEIRKAMLERFGLDYQRSSLSPQLSRLKKEGVLGQKDKYWMLAVYFSPPAGSLEEQAYVDSHETD